MEVTIRISKEDEKHLFNAAKIAGIELSQDGKDLLDEERFYKIKTNISNIFNLGMLAGMLKSLDAIKNK